jgi:hypothetical protein
VHAEAGAPVKDLLNLAGVMVDSGTRMARFMGSPASSAVGSESLECQEATP